MVAGEEPRRELFSFVKAMAWLSIPTPFWDMRSSCFFLSVDFAFITQILFLNPGNVGRPISKEGSGAYIQPIYVQFFLLQN